MKKALQQIDDLLLASKLDHALKQANKLVERFPNSADSHASLSLACMYKGQMNRARMEAERAVKLDKSNHEAHWVLTNVYNAIGLTADGAREFQLSIKNPSKRPCKPCLKKSLNL